MRLILNQIGRRLTEELPGPSQRKLLLMLDEFPALGRLDFFETALAFLAGYGIRAFLITQSLNQIEKAYGPNNSILDNCHVRIAFATNDERTAKRVSDALGTKTELRSQKNYTGHRLSPWLSHMMVSRQETQRALMTPGEVMQMPPDKEVVMISGVAAILANKLRYFKDRNFAERVTDPAAVSGVNLGVASDWSGNAAAVFDAQAHQVCVSDEGGRDIQPELIRDSVPQGSGVEPELSLDQDEGIDPAHLDRTVDIRRAAALDETDDRMLPGF